MLAKVEIQKASLNKILAILVVIELGCLIYFAHSYTSQNKVKVYLEVEICKTFRLKFQQNAKNIQRNLTSRLGSKILLVSIVKIFWSQ